MMGLGRGIIVGHLVTIRRFLRTFVVGDGRTLRTAGRWRPAGRPLEIPRTGR